MRGVGGSADDPQPPCLRHPLAGAHDVEPVAHHLLADAEAFCGDVERGTAPHDRQRRVLGEEQGSGKPLRLVLNALVPQAAPPVVERGRRVVEQDYVPQLVSQVARLPPRRVRVVVDDRASRATENGDGREDVDLDLREVPERARRVVTVVGQRDNRNLKVFRQRPRVEAVEGTEAKLRPDLSRGGVGLALEAPSVLHVSASATSHTSLLVEYLARLGVGHLVVADPERIELSNLPRVVGSIRRDAMAWLTAPNRRPRIRQLGERLARRKTAISSRVAHQANHRIRIETINGDIADTDVADRFADCDFLFLAADSMRARLVFNALVHQYLIPGAQVGAKVTVDKATGEVVDVFSVYRPVFPGSGCLWCNGLISPARLQEEALSETERRQQRYVEEETIHAPSVITLNAVATAHAVDDYLFSLTGLLAPGTSDAYRRFLPRDAEFMLAEPRRDPECTECGSGPKGRLGLGAALRLPTR